MCVCVRGRKRVGGGVFVMCSSYDLSRVSTRGECRSVNIKLYVHAVELVTFYVADGIGRYHCFFLFCKVVQLNSIFPT